jgi:hypothetical protein
VAVVHGAGGPAPGQSQTRIVPGAFGQYDVKSAGIVVSVGQPAAAHRSLLALSAWVPLSTGVVPLSGPVPQSAAHCAVQADPQMQSESARYSFKAIVVAAAAQLSRQVVSLAAHRLAHVARVLHALSLTQAVTTEPHAPPAAYAAFAHVLHASLLPASAGGGAPLSRVGVTAIASGIPESKPSVLDELDGEQPGAQTATPPSNAAKNQPADLPFSTTIARSLANRPQRRERMDRAVREDVAHHLGMSTSQRTGVCAGAITGAPHTPAGFKVETLRWLELPSAKNYFLFRQ